MQYCSSDFGGCLHRWIEQCKTGFDSGLICFVERRALAEVTYGVCCMFMSDGADLIA